MSFISPKINIVFKLHLGVWNYRDIIRGIDTSTHCIGGLLKCKLIHKAVTLILYLVLSSRVLSTQLRIHNDAAKHCE